MGTPPIRAEIVPCACGKGALTITAVLKFAGRVVYSDETVTECVACGSKDVEGARARLAAAKTSSS